MRSSHRRIDRLEPIYITISVMIMVDHNGQASIAHACEPVSIRIRRFPRVYRRRLRKLVRGSMPLTDLLYAFPGAAVALAAEHPGSGMREHAIGLVKSGRSLKKVAGALGVPMWLRRLPPEAFDVPVAFMPDDASFALRIVNLIPKRDAQIPIWLRWVAFGAQACSHDFALWLAGQMEKIEPGDDVPLLPLAIYAWYSGKRDVVASRLIEKRWHKKISLIEAVHHTRQWLERAVIEYCLGQDALRRNWMSSVSSRGFRFVPLISAEALREEGDAMQHCVGLYWDQVAIGACMIFSVRHRGKRVATLEVYRRTPTSREPHIGEFRGLANCDPDRKVIEAANAWLARQGNYPISAEIAVAGIPAHCSRWQALWQPYCAEKSEFGSGLLPLKASEMSRFFADMKALERIAYASAER